MAQNLLSVRKSYSLCPPVKPHSETGQYSFERVTDMRYILTVDRNPQTS